MTLSSALPRRNVVLAAVALLFVCRGVLALGLIPPWQQPDEPLHLLFAETARGGLFTTDPSDPYRQSEMLRSMTTYQWWERYGVPVPDPLPRTFEYVPAESGADTIGIAPKGVEPYSWYYHAFGVVFELAARAGRPLSVESELRVMRVASLVFAMLALLVITVAGIETLGAWAGVGIGLVMALHPQFAVVASAASPDAAANLAGAVLWWQGARAVSGGGLAPLLAAVVAAVVAAATDRVGIPLLAGAGLIAMWTLRQRVVRWRLTAPRWWWPVGLAIAAVIVWRLGPLVAAVAGGSAVSPRARSGQFLLEFTTLFVKTWWFTLGWIRYRPGGGWMVLPYLIAGLSAAGLAARLLRGADARRPVLALALALIVIQTAAVYWVFFRLGVAAQGRYLFPVLGPSLVVMWAGVQAMVRPSWQSGAAVGLVVAVALLDAAAWLTIGIPVYAR